LTSWSLRLLLLLQHLWFCVYRTLHRLTSFCGLYKWSLYLGTGLADLFQELGFSVRLELWQTAFARHSVPHRTRNCFQARGPRIHHSVTGLLKPLAEKPIVSNSKKDLP